jgi:hypothetical protein
LNVRIHQGNQASIDTPLTTFQKLTTNFDIVNSSGENARKDREERRGGRRELEKRKRRSRRRKRRRQQRRRRKKKNRESSPELILESSLATMVLGLFAK